MLDRRDYIAEYEDILLGKRAYFSPKIFSESVSDNGKIAGFVWRFVIDELLEADPMDIWKSMSLQLVHELHLEKTLSKIGYPVKGKVLPDLRCVLQYAYPDDPRFKYTLRSEAIFEYQKVAKIGERFANDTQKRKLPAGFFANEDGINRARYIMQYVTALFFGDMTEKQLYEFFANTAKARRWLYNKYLSQPLFFIYDTPLDYFHDSLRNRQNNFFYNSFLIKQVYEKKKDEERKERRKKN